MALNMVNALDSGSSGPGSSASRGQCVVFLGKTFNTHSSTLHPGVNGTGELSGQLETNAGGYL